MATLKLTLDKRRPYQDGRYPIIIRLCSNSKSTYIPTTIKVQAVEWNQRKNKVTKVHPDHLAVNLFLKDRILDLEKMLLRMGSQVSELTLPELKEALLNGGKKKAVLFKDFATAEIKALEDQERFGNAGVYQTTLNRLLKYAGDDLELNQITYTLLSDYDAYLIKDGLCKNTVAIHMRELRALVNKAIKKGLMDLNRYPFAGFTIRTEKTVSRAIGIADMHRMLRESLQEGSSMFHSRNIGFLIFNLIGISFIDLALLTQDSIQNGRIVYRRRKTGKIYSIKITQEAQRIFDLYKSADSKFLLPICKLEGVAKKDEIKKIHLRLHECNHHLKKLGVRCKLPIPCTTYVFRYSWAQTAKALGFSKDVIAESLGHEYGSKVTGIYLENYENEVIDQVNEAVCNRVMEVSKVM